MRITNKIILLNLDCEFLLLIYPDTKDFDAG